MKNITIIILLIIIGSGGLQAQSNIITTGGNAVGSEGSVSYSIGQQFYTQNNGIDSYTILGLQQPFEILTVSSIKTTNSISLEMSAYPNPTDDFIVLKIERVSSKLNYQIYDLNGTLILAKKALNNESIVNMENYASGMYYLKVCEGKTLLKTFKIIKN